MQLKANLKQGGGYRYAPRIRYMKRSLAFPDVQHAGTQHYELELLLGFLVNTKAGIWVESLVG